MIFVNSMSDLFHKNVPHGFIHHVFETMERADWHVFQVLTKRSSLMRDFVEGRYAPRRVPPHIWLGVSVENRQATSRVRHLRETNAAMRFLSVEPLLEEVCPLNLAGIHWVIVGGESGQRARPMRPEWVARVRDLCIAEGVSFFFKQWGAWGADGNKSSKGANGRILEGRTWDEMPLERMSAERRKENRRERQRALQLGA
jgi:protein gp37